MNTRTLTLLFTAVVLCGPVFAQKGIDTQTEKIKSEGNPQLGRPNEVNQGISWGKGKTKVRAPLANPYPLAGRRDALINTIIEVLRDQKIVVDEASSRPKDGMIITQPFVFAKGSVVAPGELGRYAVIPYEDKAWSRGQYTLTIEVQTIDGVHNNVSVNAKVEGRAGNGIGFEWRTVQSSGLAEDEFLAKLVEASTGVSPDVPTDH